MSESIPTFRMMLLARKAGWYGYIIGQYDEPGWMQRSMESFSSMAEAAKAGRRVMEIKARKLSEESASVGSHEGNAGKRTLSDV